MGLIDQQNLAFGANSGDFQHRVRAACVHAATAVAAEVTSDLQTLSISGSPTGGTFTLSFGGNTTAAIPFNAAAGQVEVALKALASIGAGNMVCGGGPLPGTPVTCTFNGTLYGTPQNAITIGANSLTGGSTPTPSVAHTTVGLGFVQHSARQALANKVLIGTFDTSRFYEAVADNATIQTDYPAPNYTLNVAASQADNDIQFVVNGLWNAFALSS